MVGKGTSKLIRCFLAGAALALATPASHGAVTVLVGEPYGSFGTMMPVGHATIYLDRVCADGPLRLRMCRPDEPQGVALARYHQLGKTDWIATPILQFLYATDRPENIAAYVTREQAGDLRDLYRRQYLEALVPDGHEKDAATDEWDETAGAAFDRRLWGYQLASTREQDQAIVAQVNADANHHRYRLHGSNCADFAAQIVNTYYPGIVRAAVVADFGIMSPKQVARCIAAYGKAHPEAGLRVFEVAQVDGDLRRSRPARFGMEGILKTKRYLATLLVIQPELPLVMSLLYLDRGRWTLGRGAEILQPSVFDEPRTVASQGDLPTPSSGR